MTDLATQLADTATAQGRALREQVRPDPLAAASTAFIVRFVPAAVREEAIAELAKLCGAAMREGVKMGLGLPVSGEG